jgi:fructokinase
VIVVAGEALVDLVIDVHGDVTAALGGAPFNTARTCGRLGADVAFVGAISADRFGTLLSGRLADDGVRTDRLQRVDLPTTLAAAELDAAGAATYRFYFAGTSAPALTSAPLVQSGDIVFTGGLALVLEPMAETVATLVADAAGWSLVMVDVNCRPQIVPDRTTYVARLGRVLAGTDVVKASDDDLDYLFPAVDPLDAARGLLDRGPVAVLVTRGGAGVDVVVADGHRRVPVEPVGVVDTIGAGDSFAGGFLTWWVAAGLGRSEIGSLDHLVGAVAAANSVAGVVCTRRGADPPWRSDLPDGWSP